jgi:hypothetical protein
VVLPFILPFSHSGIGSDFFRPILVLKLYIMIIGYCTLVFHVHFSLLQLRSPWPGDHPYQFNCDHCWPCSPLSHARVGVLNPTSQLVKESKERLVTRDQLMTREWQTMREWPLPHHEHIHLQRITVNHVMRHLSGHPANSVEMQHLHWLCILSVLHISVALATLKKYVACN